MMSIQRAVLRLILTTALCGCVDHKQASIDNAYQHGQISSDQRRRQTDELIHDRQAQSVASMEAFQQQPTKNPNADKMVYSQREVMEFNEIDRR